MMAFLAALLFLPWNEPTPGIYLDGKATYYGPGVMEQVAANRDMDLDGAIGFVALNRAGDLSRLVWLERNGIVAGPYRVADCAQEGAHYEERERRGLIVEVSWEQGQRWKMRGPVPVRVWLIDPREPEGAT